MTQRLLVAGGTEATRYSSPGCYAEPGDSRANVEEEHLDRDQFRASYRLDDDGEYGKVVMAK